METGNSPREHQYIVAVPTNAGGMFVTYAGLSAEYPNARFFYSLGKAKVAAKEHAGGQVYLADDYAAGNGPTWVAP